MNKIEFRAVVHRIVHLLIASAFMLAAGAVSAADFDFRYTARVGDSNGDGLTDVYLEHKPKLAIVSVSDITVPIALSKTVYRNLLLLRQANDTFGLVTTLNSAQVSQGRTWPTAHVVLGNGDYNGDGSLDLFISSIPSASSPSSFRDVVVLAPSSTVSAQAVDGLIANTYYVRVGDIDNDGGKDFFVTGNAKRFVSDFILRRGGGTQPFAVWNNLTSVQRQVASSWPIANISVFREDLNLDGYYDFYFENITSAAPTYQDDLVVFTQRNVGSTAYRAAAVNPYTARDIGMALTTGHPFLTEFYRETCYSTYTGDPGPFLPEVPYDWIFTGAPDNWYRNQYIVYYGGIAFSNGYRTELQTCVVHGPKMYGPEVIKFVRSLGDYVGAGGADCETCAQRGEAVLAQTPGWMIWTRVLSEVGAAEASAFILAAVLAGNDDQGVGTVDELVHWIAVQAFAFEIAQKVLTPGMGGLFNEDAGPTPPPATPTSDMTSPGDPFQMPPEFDPDDPNKPQVKVPGEKSDSWVLGQNLVRAGWPKPPGAQAHHIVQGTDSFIESVQAREILRRAGMYQNEAANGVWLPARTSPTTTAQGHLAEGMHTNLQRREVLRLLQEACQDPSNVTVADQPAIRAVLNYIRERFLAGPFP
jgi:hypothetical protein